MVVVVPVAHGYCCSAALADDRTANRPAGMSWMEESNMNAITLLKREHDRLTNLLKRAQCALSADERCTLFNQVAGELRVHNRVEEKTFYAAVEQYPAARGSALESRETHLIAARLVRELEETPPTDERWIAKLAILVQTLERHMREEHEKIFPAMKAILGERELDRIGARMEKLIDTGTN